MTSGGFRQFKEPTHFAVVVFRDSERLQLALIILVWLDDCQIRHIHTEWYITVYHARLSADMPN